MYIVLKPSLSFSRLGIIVVNDAHDIIWTNEIISQVDEHLLDKNILDIFPQLREFQEATDEEKIIKVKIKDIIFDVNFVKSSNVYFFKNVTDYDNLIKYSIEQAVVLGIVMIDNYEELAEGQEETSDTLSRVKTKINEYFKEYVRENKLPIDISDFENRYWYLDSRTLRGTINDHEFKITFEQLEGLINYLNSKEKHIDEHINFDEYVMKHINRK